MSVAAWAGALAVMESELDAHEAALRSGDVDVVPPFVAPEDLGDLPPALAERALKVNERAHVLMSFVQCQLLATSNDLRHADRRRGGSLTPAGVLALYLDASA